MKKLPQEGKLATYNIPVPFKDITNTVSVTYYAFLVG